MASEPARATRPQAAKSPVKAAVESPAARSRRLWRGFGWLVLAAVVAAGVAATFAWRELDTEALRRAEAAYRRGDLRSALRLARGHLTTRPSSQRAALIAARCL